MCFTAGRKSDASAGLPGAKYERMRYRKAGRQIPGMAIIQLISPMHVQTAATTESAVKARSIPCRLPTVFSMARQFMQWVPMRRKVKNAACA